jgi:hypothetical protein
VNGDYPDNIKNQFDTDFELAANLVQEEGGHVSRFPQEIFGFSAHSSMMLDKSSIYT